MFQMERRPHGDDPTDGIIEHAIGTVLAFTAEEALMEAARIRGFRTVQAWQDSIAGDAQYFRSIEVFGRAPGLPGTRRHRYRLRIDQFARSTCPSFPCDPC